MSYYMGVDLGGTTIGMGILDENMKLLVKLNARTPKNPTKQKLIETIIMEITDFLRENNITLSEVNSIGIGVPGQVSSDYSTMLRAANLGLTDVNLKTMLEGSLRTSVYICNDADAAAYGEAKAGSGSGYHKSITVTIGTGIGTGIVIGSELLPSEGGHMVIVHDGIQCACGRKGCFEQYASTTALVSQIKTAMEQHPESLMHDVVRGNKGYVSGKTVFLAMEQGDKVAKQVFDTYINYLGCGLTSLANTLMPDIICLSGGISMQGEKLTNPLNEYLAKQQYPLENGVHSLVVPCQLSSDAGMIGAAIFAKERMELCD